MRRSRFLVSVGAAALAITLSLGAAAPRKHPGIRTIVYLVRHAEKANAADADPALSAAGTERARALSTALADAGVQAIATTELQRTMLTAQPFAAAQHIRIETVKTDAALSKHARAVSNWVSEHNGEVLLIVGHSNSVPAIIAALGGPKMTDICDGEYDNLYMMVLDDDGSRLARTKFGAADAPDPKCAH